jgi:hypothetical protein
MSKHNPRSNTNAIKLFQAYMASKGTPVTKPVDVVRGCWWPMTDKVSNDTKKVGK